MANQITKVANWTIVPQSKNPFDIDMDPVLNGIGDLISKQHPLGVKSETDLVLWKLRF